MSWSHKSVRRKRTYISGKMLAAKNLELTYCNLSISFKLIIKMDVTY